MTEKKAVFCKHSNQEKFPFVLPDLPYSVEAFKPHLSSESFVYHHGKHHNAYVVNLNKLIQEKEVYADKDLETVILESNGRDQGVFNNAAQVWNHSFFWHSIKPNGGSKPSGKMLELIERDFGSYEAFCEEFKNAAVSQFGSGWVWLVQNEQKKLQIVKTSNAETPITSHLKPIVACDVWEHAYYIDYRNKRPDYVSVYLNNIINWEFAENNLS